MAPLGRTDVVVAGDEAARPRGKLAAGDLGAAGSSGEAGWGRRYRMLAKETVGEFFLGSYRAFEGRVAAEEKRTRRGSGREDKEKEREEKREKGRGRVLMGILLQLLKVLGETGNFHGKGLFGWRNVEDLDWRCRKFGSNEKGSKRSDFLG